MQAIIGRKIGMSQMFGDRGKVIPVTLVEAGPCVVTQLRDAAKDGYTAVQLGFGEAKKLNKPGTGHLKASKAKSSVLREFRWPEQPDGLKVGDTLDVSQFEAGQQVKVTAISKGKGFAGTVKRHNFNTGPKTHGSDDYRTPGSIGSMYPQKVMKGKKMAGRMGHDRVTIKNVKIADVQPEKNLLALTGAVPGANRSIVIIKGMNATLSNTQEPVHQEAVEAVAATPESQGEK